MQEKTNKLSALKMIQIVLAVVLSIVLLVSVPVFAWLSYNKSIMKLQKVDTPNPLYLSAAHREDSSCFKMEGIDAEEILVDRLGNPIKDNLGNEQKITYKYYPFTVTGESVSKFTIQLAYTTNNPFTYEIYAAKELKEIYTAAELAANPEIGKGVEMNYVAYSLTGKNVVGMPVPVGEQYNTDVTYVEGSETILYYQIDTTVQESANPSIIDNTGKYIGEFRNSTDGSSANNDANNIYLEKAYGEYTNIESDAKPVYWQVKNVDAVPGSNNSAKSAFSRYFILKISWAPGTIDNISKETDILYITVRATA